MAGRFRIPLQIAQALVSPAAARRRVDQVGRRLRSRLTVPVGVTGTQRLDHTQHLLGTVVIPIMPTITPVAGAGFLAQALAGKLARAELEPGEADEVLRGLPHNVTTTMDLRLWALASRVRTDPTATAALHGTAPVELARRFTSRQLPPLLQRGLEEFLAQHGHRAVAEIDVGMPRWSDDPTHIVGVLANYLRLQDPDLAPDAQFARGARAADAAATRVASRVRRRSRLRATAVRVALGRARELVGLRETHKDYLVRVLAHVREQLAAVGAELAGRGQLAESEDVFFLDLVQARAALEGRDFRAVVAQRRQDYERELRRRQVPRIMLSDCSVPEALATPHQRPVEGQLTGTPASAGTATAMARVVLDPVGAHLEPGEILVEGQMRALADRLAITVPEHRWPELVSAATFGQMRARAALTAPNAQSGIWHDNEHFFHRGTSGQWRDLLDADDLERYRARAEAIGPSAVVDWVHRGSL